LPTASSPVGVFLQQSFNYSLDVDQAYRTSVFDDSLSHRWSGLNWSGRPLIAPNGPASRGDQCPLIGVKQTQCGHAATSEFDPFQTLHFLAGALPLARFIEVANIFL
jgi:hypothetical protein